MPRGGRSCQHVGVPARFDAVREALLDAEERVPASCWTVGRELADVGISLGEGLDGLRATTRAVRGRDPAYAEMQALCLAWSDQILAYLHGLSCADPLTGLATLAHVRDRIGDLYRTGGASGHALVVARTDLPAPEPDDSAGPSDAVTAARRLTLTGAAARAVFAGQETIGRVGHGQLVVLVARDAGLPARVALLRRMIAADDRVWIEGLPPTDAGAAILLDELARAG